MNHNRTPAKKRFRSAMTSQSNPEAIWFDLSIDR